MPGEETAVVCEAAVKVDKVAVLSVNGVVLTVAWEIVDETGEVPAVDVNGAVVSVSTFDVPTVAVVGDDVLSVPLVA